MKLNKYFILGVALLGATFSMHAQQSEAFVPRTNVKLSALAAIGIVNPAVEFRVDEKWSVQLEGMGVFAAENFLGTGYPLQIGAAFVEARWYPKGVFRKFFLAPNVGGGAFRLNKNILHKFFGWASDLNYKKHEDAVHVGHNFMGGVTLGYVFTFPKNPHWSIEANWSFGRQWAKYESYIPFGDNLIHHEELGGSAEYLPFYRGGIFVSYKW
jgi:hypothetical protein